MGGSSGVFGPSWSLWECFLGVLAASWGDLGVILEPLGGSWSPLPLPPASEQIDTSTPHPPFSTLKLNSTSLNLTPLNSTQLISLFDPPRPPFGSLLGAQIDPRSAQDRPKSPLDTLFVQTCDLTRNITFSKVSGVWGVPRRLPKRPRIAPRQLQDGLGELLFSSSFFTSILYRFCSVWAPHMPPSWDLFQNRNECLRGPQGIVFT